MSILSSCTLSKNYRYQKSGSFTQSNFFEELDFEYSGNLIVVDVQIEGKIYPLIFDTGAELSLLDKEIIDKISHKKLSTSKVTGASGVSNQFEIIELPKMKIGDLNFNDLTVISHDFSAINERYKCDKSFYGIIGSNLMRKAKWKIDYQNQKIQVSDQLSSLGDLSQHIVIDLEGAKVGSAYISASLDGVETRFTFDTGKSTKTQTNMRIMKKLLEKNEKVQYTPSKGITGVTLNGVQYGTVNYTLIEKMKIGNLELDQQVVEIEDNEVASNLLGNEIWKNFHLTIDWQNMNLYLDPVETIPLDTLFSFGYDIVYNERGDGIKLSNQWLEHSSNLKIKNDNELLSVDGHDITKMNTSEFCSFVKDDLVQLKKKEQLPVRLLIDGKEKELILKREQLLPK